MERSLNTTETCSHQSSFMISLAILRFANYLPQCLIDRLSIDRNSHSRLFKHFYRSSHRNTSLSFDSSQYNSKSGNPRELFHGSIHEIFIQLFDGNPLSCSVVRQTGYRHVFNCDWLNYHLRFWHVLNNKWNKYRMHKHVCVCLPNWRWNGVWASWQNTPLF